MNTAASTVHTEPAPGKHTGPDARRRRRRAILDTAATMLAATPVSEAPSTNSADASAGAMEPGVSRAATNVAVM
jgi:hypothetical protein